MKTNKKFLKVLTSVGLVAAIGVGFTLAYMTADTGTKVNSFTSTEGITGSTTETEWDKNTNSGKDFLPGDAFYKDPTVAITGKNDAYVALKVSVVDKTTGTDVAMSLEDFTLKYGTFYYGNPDTTKKVDISELTKGMNIGEGTTNWTDKTANVAGLFVYNSVVAKETSADNLFDAVQINAGVYKYFTSTTTTGTTYKYKLDTSGNKIDKNEDGKITIEDAEEVIPAGSSTFVSSEEVVLDANGEIINGAVLPKFDIVVKGYAVQADNVDMATATAELVNLAKNG